VYGHAVLADDWWFWALVAVVVGVAALASRRYRAAASAVRRRALDRRLIVAGAGRRVDTRPGGFRSDLSWLSILLGAWVAASPWIWRYDEVSGAVATDVVTGGAVVALTLASIAFPSLGALSVLAGLWLVTAPWLVGYGDHDGPVGLSDVLAGAAIAGLAIAGLAAAAKRVVPGEPMPAGRVERSRGPSPRL
jgi:hypothetical protein